MIAPGLVDDDVSDRVDHAEGGIRACEKFIDVITRLPVGLGPSDQIPCRSAAHTVPVTDYIGTRRINPRKLPKAQTQHELEIGEEGQECLISVTVSARRVSSHRRG